MKDDLNGILEKFDNGKFLFEEFASTLTQLIKALMTSSNIKPHQIAYRIKDRNSLEKKIVRKDYKYREVSELTDICGIRIITYLEDDVDRIAKLLDTEFDIDVANSIDKRIVDADKFGYRSLHYVLQLKKERLALTEYKKYKCIKAEIQIRTILQHSWAEIEHDLGYKGEMEIPILAKRTFYRVAALLEQADIEFVKLKSEIVEYEKKITEEIKYTPDTVSIDKASLISFVKHNKLIIETENSLNPLFERIDVEPSVITPTLQRLYDLNITSIKQLEDAYAANIDKIKKFLTKRLSIKVTTENQKSSKFVGGASILWLCNILEEPTEL